MAIASHTGVNLEAQHSETVVDLDERNWLPRHCRGDDGAFAELLEAYQASVYGYLVRCGVPPASRDDVFQEIFVKVHLAASSYQPSRPLRPWLFTIAANTVRNHLRDEGRRQSRHASAGEWESPDRHPGPQARVETDEILAWVEKAVPTLPFEQREVLMLCSMGGLRLKEVAVVLGKPLNTVKTHARRARIALARALAEYMEGGEA